MSQSSQRGNCWIFALLLLAGASRSAGAEGLGVGVKGGTTGLGVELTKGGRVVVGSDLSVPGFPEVFAVGDIADYLGKLKLILCGFSEAAMAAHGAYPLVHPNEALHFEYSTTKGVPG